MSTDTATAATHSPPLQPGEIPEPQITEAQQEIHEASAPPPRDTAASVRSKGLNGRVRVLVRCRPLTHHEQGHTTNRIHVRGNNTVVVNDAVVGTGARQFSFDAVLPPEADQAVTFAEVEPLIDHALDGFHATVFAYGQTGSGKTHTMEGLSYVRKAQRGRSFPAERDLEPEEDDTGTAAVADMDTAVEEHGIMPRAIQLLFDRAHLRQGDDVLPSLTTGEPDDMSVQYSFRCSYYQIYNEVITDLLRGESPGIGHGAGGGEFRSHGASTYQRGNQRRSTDLTGLNVRWQKDNTFRVQNLFLCECESAEQMRDALFSGVQRKVMSSHNMNHQSSRSHCVFTVYIECRRVKTGDLVSRSELSMVDLAGSEKLSLLASNPTRTLVRESIDINTSLLALGKVITALAANSRRNARLNGKRAAALGSRKQGRPAAHTLSKAAGAGHIPYRDSKLTMLLKHALGGNSVTLMVACISPSDRYVEETVSTLLYAGRASNIENVPHVNEDPTATLIAQLREEIRQLKEELRHYRTLAEKGLLPGGAVANVTATGDAPASANEALVAMGGGPSGNSAVDGRGIIDTHDDLQRQSDTLADSLMTACEMLQSVFATNGQLRDAYDVVKAAKEAADVREVQLNAENIALRERIQTLEAIVLDGRHEQDADQDGAEDSSQDDGNGDQHSEEPSERRKGSSKQMRTHLSAGAASTQRDPVSTTDRNDNTSVKGADQPLRRSIDWSKPQPLTESQRQKQRTQRVHLEDLVETERDLAEAPRHLVKHDSSGQPEPPRRQAADKKKEKKRRRKEQKRSQRLSAYEKKYRGVARNSGDGVLQQNTYATYYGRAAKASHRHTAGDSDDPATAGADKNLSSLAVRRQLLASRGDMQHTVTTTVVEVQTMMKKLPDTVVNEFVPQSLKHSRTYGALAFCGGEEAGAPTFEQKRAEREARRRELLERQQHLLQNIHTVIAERRFNQPSMSTTSRQSGEQGPVPQESARDRYRGQYGSASLDPLDPDGVFSPPTQSLYADPTPSGPVNVISLESPLGRVQAARSTPDVVRQRDAAKPKSAYMLAAERAAPRWETGVAPQDIRTLRAQPDTAYALNLTRSGREGLHSSLTSGPYASRLPNSATPGGSVTANPYATSRTPSTARKVPKSGSGRSDKASSMDKLLQYLHSQQE